MAEEEVHGSVEVRVQPDEQDDEQVGQHHGQVHVQEQGKENALAGWRVPGRGTWTRCSDSLTSCSSSVCQGRRLVGNVIDIEVTIFMIVATTLGLLSCHGEKE